jgi:hypothetical protein
LIAFITAGITQMIFIRKAQMLKRASIGDWSFPVKKDYPERTV